MPNYPTHARWGRAGAVLTGFAVGAGLFLAFESPLLAGGGALGAAAVTFVGAVFPDIDHHSSIPRRKASRAIRLLSVLGVASLAALHFESLVAVADGTVADPPGGPEVPPETVAGVGTAVAALAAAGSVDPVLGALTREHRGWTHSAPVMLVLTAVLAAGVGVVTRDLSVARQTAAVVVVATFFLGCLVHIGLDGELR